MNRCHGCGADLEGGVVLHRSRLFCALACALDHQDAEWAAARAARAPGRPGVPPVSPSTATIAAAV